MPRTKRRLIPLNGGREDPNDQELPEMLLSMLADEHELQQLEEESIRQEDEATEKRHLYQITPLTCRKVEELAARGLTNQQICECLGWKSTQTLERKRRLYEDFDAAIKRGRSRGVATVTNALFEAALGGNVQAQMFYLKNRAQWTDKHDINANVTVSHEEWLKQLQE